MNYFIRNEKIAGFTNLQVKRGKAEGLTPLTNDQLEKHLSINYTFDGTDFVSVITVESQTTLTKAQCSQRILAEYSWSDQANITSGVVEDPEGLYPAWVKACLDAQADILAREDLLDLDVTSDQLWPEGGAQ